MSLVIPKRLPSLACPLIGSSNGVWKKDKGLFLPPFSEIDLNWKGCCFSHLDWVVLNLNEVYIGVPEFERRIQIYHELYHKMLTKMPFMQLKKYYICEFYDLILKTFEKGKVIRVPLRENKPWNELRKKWERILDMKEASDKVEEILAVRSSLVSGLHEGLITHKELKVKTEQYKKAYSEFISGYAEAYEEFECIAKKIGETAAAGLIFHVLEACHPGIAFEHTMSAIHKIDSRDRDFLRNLRRGPREDAIDQMFGFFDKLTDQLDPDNHYAKEQMRILDVAENIKRKFSALSKELEYDSTNFLFLSLNEYLLSNYTAEYRPFGYIRLDFSLKELKSDQRNYKLQELSSRPIVLLLESVRQQLTSGIGLLCPFWEPSHPCCSSRNRAFLEKVWSCTQRNSACERWQRLGCLNEGRCDMPCGGNSLQIKC